MIYHNHHIIPRHVGGTDDPSNLIRLTIPEHADAHRVLWEEHGRIEDKLAWLMLSGKTDEAEAARIELSRQIQQRRWSEPGARQAQRERMRGNTLGVGSVRHHSDETKGRISASQKERYHQNPHPMEGRSHTEETKQKIRDSKRQNPYRHSVAVIKQIADKRRGKPQPDSQKQKVAAALSKTWDVTTPTGERLVVVNLRQYCLEHHLNQGNLITYEHTKGYRAVKRDIL